MKFSAMQRLEKEMKIEFKGSILDPVYHLIDHLDCDNPFGEINNEIRDYGDSGKIQKISNLEYMGVEVKPGEQRLKHAIETVQKALKDRGLADSFMHGTSATKLEKIAEHGSVKISSEREHDFGRGLYCFKGHLNRAILYAFHRSWPDLTGKSKRSVALRTIEKDNPSVVVFPNSEITYDEGHFHVGFQEHTFSEKKLRDNQQLVKSGYFKGRDKWDKKDKNEFRWKEFVKLARCHYILPTNCSVFRGWLHDSDCLQDTDNCREPKIEKDKWEQYCFTPYNSQFVLDQDHLLFIEFFIDWAEWVGSK